MNIKYYIKKVDGLSLPKRANDTDAGYDVVATTDPMVKGVKIYDAYNADTGLWSSVDYVEYGTNLYIVPDSGKTSSTKYTGAVDTHNVHTDLRPRSSISSKTNFVLANSIGLIDRGYHNQVMVRFKYIFQPSNLGVRDGYITGRVDPKKMYNKGDAIAQILPMLTHDINFDIVDTLPGEDRGGGFGSTDIKKLEIAKPIAPQPKTVKTDSNSIFSRGVILGGKVTVREYLRTNDSLRGHNVKSNDELIDTVELWAKNIDGDIYSYAENGQRGICIVSSEGDIISKYPIGFSV